MLRLRRNILPSRLIDAAFFLLIFVFTPITFVFEMIIVLPVFHEFGGFFHTYTMILALFLIFQIKGNMIACMMVDTSVDFDKLKPPTDKNKLDLWHKCETCKKLAPPRSYHCKVCKVCVMKRDHHCLFTGCCVGHLNHRYFMMFVVYLFIGSTYALVYNSLYLWYVHAAVYTNWLTVLKMTCPMIMFVTGSFWSNFYLVIYNLNIIAVVYSTALCAYHGSTIWQGGVCNERGKYEYKLGWRTNLEMVFGKQMHKVWISPLIRSELPHDGVHWETVLEKKSVFLIINVKGNMLACMLVDTSIKTEVLTPPTDHDNRKLWRLCAVCETLAPPRSWHCNICNTCILKRDHHCMFTGCCVGHRNHRYFLMFLVFIMIGSLYTTVYNSFYFWWLNADTYANYFTLFKMVFPMLMFTVDSSWHNFYLLIYELNVVALAYSMVLLVYHGQIILRGGVIHERNAHTYDLGWKKNLQMVLGTRMHLVWLSPFLKSPLPHDGINWQTVLQNSQKNR